MRRRLTLLLVLIALAVPLFARVVSYAPYTNRVARAGYHLRTTRWFPLIEGGGFSDPKQQLVLYDSSGREEPRAVFPKTDETLQLNYVGWFERDTLETSMAVANYIQSNGSYITVFSRDGGATWTRIAALDGGTSWDEQVDRGGPWVHGLMGQVRVGNAANPFVVQSNGSIWVINANGEARRLVENSARVIGQNRAGTEYLIEKNTQVLLMNLNGGFNVVRETNYYGGGTTGWVTDNDSVYIQQGPRFYLHRGPQVELVYEYTGPSWTGLIAVPSHDFNGAWIVDRASGRPTVLMHHSPSLGRREMWRDVAAPEVEALIPGDSGQTVLIQVHRDHSVALQQPFIDPALAVWRVGDPAPRDYDELYVNEEENKGFVHIDPDKVAAGDPFVFDSGSFENGGPEEGPISPPIGGGGDVIQEWGVVRASLKQRLILPGVARLRGAFDSSWLTDVTIYNPLDTAQEVEVQYVPLGQAVQAEGAHKVTLSLRPFEIRFIPDTLHALFALETGGGALHFLPATAVNVIGRTYSRKGDGTFGFGMQAIDAFNAAGPRFPVTFGGAFPGENFRTNILLTDTSGRGTEASMNAYGVSGALGSSQRTLSAPANGIFQLNGLGSTMGLFSRDAGGLTVQPTRGTAIATVVAIDNRTNDPTYFPPDLTATIRRAIPVIGHVDGAHGAHFRSDLYLFNAARQTRTVTLEAKQWDSPTRVTRTFTLLPNEARIVPDALVTLFGMTGLARLNYQTFEEGDGVRVTSRTYTREESGATYGSLIPPLNNFQIGTAGDALEILGAGGGPGFRTNLGLVELSQVQNGGPVRVRVRIIGSERSSADSFIVEVPRTGGMQIGDIFTARGIAAPTAALLVVEVLDPGLIGAYATLTDNKTNDTTYLGAQLGGKEE